MGKKARPYVIIEWEFATENKHFLKLSAFGKVAYEWLWKYMGSEKRSERVYIGEWSRMCAYLSIWSSFPADDFLPVIDELTQKLVEFEDGYIIIRGLRKKHKVLQHWNFEFPKDDKQEPTRRPAVDRQSPHGVEPTKVSQSISKQKAEYSRNTSQERESEREREREIERSKKEHHEDKPTIPKDKPENPKNTSIKTLLKTKPESRTAEEIAIEELKTRLANANPFKEEPDDAQLSDAVETCVRYINMPPSERATMLENEFGFYKGASTNAAKTPDVRMIPMMWSALQSPKPGLSLGAAIKNGWSMDACFEQQFREECRESKVLFRFGVD